MRALFPPLLGACCYVLTCTTLHAQTESVQKALAELKARPFAAPQGSQPLSVHLAALEKQTGSALADRRSKANDPKIELSAKERNYWEAVRDLAEAVGCGVSLFDPDGPGLVDGRFNKQQPVSIDGIVLVAVKRWTVQRDEEAGSHVAQVTLDIAWEPRFEPFYLEVRPANAVVGEQTFKITGQGKESVAHHRAAEISLRLPAPARSVAQVDSLEGELRFIGPSKMLDFVFPNASAAKSITQEDVTVSMKPGSRNPWAFDMAIVNPTGGPVFESFQTWLDNNRIQLERTQNGKTEVWRPDPNAEELLGMLTAENATIRYVFEGTQGKAPPSQWSLRYRTPGRIIELPVRFKFKNLRLP